MFRKLYIIFVTIWGAISFTPRLLKSKKLPKDSLEKKEIALGVENDYGDMITKVIEAELTIKGENNIPKNETALYIANHLSFYDIPLLFKLVHDQIGFVAKIELNKIPILKSWITEMNGVFLDRNNKKKSLKTMKEAIEILKKGHSLAIFPQGTREKKKKIAFKGGSFSLAKSAKVQVVPVAISGTDKIIKGDVRKSGIQVTFLNPFFINPKENVNEIAMRVEEEIRKERENHKILIKK